MRAMRAAHAALLSARSFPVVGRSVRALPTPSRAPSRLVSTEAAVEGSTASKPSRLAASRGDRLVKEMTPIATFLGIVVTIGAVGAYYSSCTSALEERMIGVMKEVEAKNAGVVKEVEAKNAGSEKAVAKAIAGFKEAADLKVRS